MLVAGIVADDQVTTCGLLLQVNTSGGLGSHRIDFGINRAQVLFDKGCDRVAVPIVPQLSSAVGWPVRWCVCRRIIAITQNIVGGIERYTDRLQQAQSDRAATIDENVAPATVRVATCVMVTSLPDPPTHCR